MIIFRNKYGYDNIDLSLIYLFKRERTNRIEINEHLKVQNMKFPANLLSYI